MNRLTDNKIVLVTRPTRLAELVIRFNTVSQARFYVEHQGADFSDYLREDQTYHRALSETQAALAQVGRVQIVDRACPPHRRRLDRNDVVAQCPPAARRARQHLERRAAG